MNSQTITIPWGAFYRDERLPLAFPDSWKVDRLSIKSLPPVSREIINAEVEKFVQLLEQRKPERVAIAVDDLTRPLSYGFFLEKVLDRMGRWTKPPRVTILIGLGTHRPLEDEEIELKVGARVRGHEFVRVINHDCHNDVQDTGVIWGKVPVKVNRYFLEADFRAIFSTIVPHPFAGFSGGAKMVIPGLSNIEVTRRTHQMALMGFVGKTGNVEQNKLRKILDELIDQIGVDYFVGFLSNEDRQCIHIRGGLLPETYYELCRAAVSVYTTPVPDQVYDIVWLNAYPKDSELLQIETAFNPVQSGRRKFWHTDSVIVVSAACSRGLGYHGLFGPEGVLYRKPREKRVVKGQRVFFLVPEVAEEEFYQVFWEGYRRFTAVREVMTELHTIFGDAPTAVAVFPVASLQLTT